ncbi:MAG: zinc-ribbon domain-containing protein [Alphaproteobacteria bacterium]|nr:zinc-ribbon domain-containing protein [Alphaproteobacteria bacterium]
MILTCPACATRYQADEAKFPPLGRQVRCAKCGHVWHQPGPVAAAESDAPPAPPPQAAEPSVSRARVFAPSASMPEEQGEPLARGAMLAVIAGWIGLIALIAAIGYAAMRYRQEIAVIWPQSAGVYSAMGIKLNPQGIDFTKVDYRRESEDGQIVLVVTGNIVNAGSRELSVPQNVRVTLSDDKNHEIYHWNFTPNVQALKPGQSSPFLTRLSTPPAAARHLEVRFAPHD